MFKAMILLKRKEEYSQREFRNWWLGEHASQRLGQTLRPSTW